MKKIFLLSLLVILLGFSLVAAQTPDPSYLLKAVSTPIHVNSTDLDNNQVPDLVFITFGGDSIITMLGIGDGTFGTRRAFAGWLPFFTPADIIMNAVDFADFNGDGNMDLVIASRGPVNVLVFFGNGDGTITMRGGASGSPAFWVVTGNFDFFSPPNLDADFVLFVNTSSVVTDTIQYWAGDGTGSFFFPTQWPTGGIFAYFMTKQADPASGLEHIAVAHSSGDIGLLVSNGDGTFQPTVTIPTRPDAYGIAWDLLNNDNFLDLAYTDINTDSLFVRTGTGLTTYNSEVSYPTSPAPFGMCSGDFTGDGFTDLAVVNLSTDSVNFFLNNGTGGFSTRVDAETNVPGYVPTAADINLNGVPDLLIGATFGDSIAIFNLKAPSVSPSFLSGNPPAGAPFTLPVITASDATNIASVELMYRQMGKTAYSTLLLTEVSAGTPTLRDYTGTLLALAMTNRGLEYFFRTSDGFVTANALPVSLPFRRLRTSITQNAPATFDRAYQLVSLPMGFSSAANGSASIQIADDFSLTDPNVARLFWWDPVKADTITTDTTSLKGYREFGTSGFPNFTPGLSMFLATVGSKVYDGVGLSTLPNRAFFFPTPNGDSVLVFYTSLVIDSGWNMIASPYPYTVHMDSVDILVPALDAQIHELDSIRNNRIGFGSANLRERTSSGYIPPSPPLLKPWRGYFLKNNVDQLVTLLFPTADGNFPATTPVISKAFAAGLDWKIDITAKSGEMETPPTTLGTSKAALREYDRLDWELPPALPGDLRVVFQRGKNFGLAGDYLTDIRPTLTESETWGFTVAPGGTRVIEMNFDGLADVPADYDVILTDKEGRAKQNLRLEPVYRLIASGDRHFELTVAPKVTGQVALLPAKYDLHQNFPNPFNPQTLIKYDLPEAATVRLDVFNILGQRVTTLVNRFEAAGPKSVVWNGTDAHGAKVSSGIYFYKISTDDFSATKKMTLVK